MASILKRGPNQWQAKVRRAGSEKQSKTFASKADAQAWAREIESEMDRGVFVSRVEAEHTTLTDALDRYAREVTPRKKGFVQELSRIKKWQGHALAARYLSTIRGADLAAYRDMRRGKRLAENTIRLDLALISHVFETARKEWGMESLANPVRNIKAPSGSKQRDRRLRDHEERYLLAGLGKMPAPVMCPVVVFAIETGMRRSEILSLTWDAVNINRRVAQLPVTKNGSSRAVPLSSRAIAVLSAMARPPPIEGQVFPIALDRLSHLFARACGAGREIYLEDCEREHKTADKDFLTDLHFHDLRHEATSRFFEQRLELMEVAAITGHKTLSMLRRYTHLRAEDLAKKLR